MVTGSSSGIGYETARVLANKQASIIIAVRNL
ncbi:MAG: short-chain dehydrogenase, partial [Nostoc sp.]